MGARETAIVTAWMVPTSVTPLRNAEVSRDKFSADGVSGFSKYIVLPANPEMVPVLLRRECILGDLAHGYIYSLRTRSRITNVVTVGAALKEACNYGSSIYEVEANGEKFYCGRGIILDKEMTPLLIVFCNISRSSYEAPKKMNVFLDRSIFMRSTALEKYIADKLLGAIVEFSRRATHINLNFLVDDPEIKSYFISATKPTGLIDNTTINAKVKELLPFMM